jgi:tetratricopeptide (TPR) repeat protein
MRRSLSLLREAIALTPDFALAWAGLSDSYTIMAQLGVLSPAEAIEPARHAAERALQLNPELGEAEASLGLITALHDWDWNAAELHLQRAMQLSPGYAIAFFWYSIDYCALRGYFREAEAVMAEAELLDPLSSNIRMGMPYLLMLERRYEEALAATDRMTDLDPEFSRALTMRGRILIQLGEYREAAELLRRESESSRMPSTLGALGQAWALAGERQKALDALNQLRDMHRRTFVQASCLAAVLIGLGEYDEAVAVLRGGAERRELSVASIGAHPLYDPLRTRSAFKELVERVGC